MARYIMSYCLSVSIIVSLSDSLYYSYSFISISLITLGCFLVHSISLYSKKHFYITVLSFLGCAILTGLVLSYLNRLHRIVQGAIAFFQEISKTVTLSNYSLPNEYIIFSIVLIALLVTLIVHIFTVRLYKHQIILISGLIYFICSEIFQLSYSKIGFFLFCFIGVMYYFERNILRHIGWMNKRDIKKIMSRGSLIVIGMFLITSSFLLVYRKTDPLGWIDELISDVKNVFTTKLEETANVEQDRSTSDLQKKPIHDETLIMTVETDDIIYLRGMVFDTFSGSTWTGGEQPLYKERNYEENIMGLKQLSGDDIELESYFTLSSATVKHKNITEDIHFTHLNSMELVETRSEESEEFTYTFQYYQPKYDNPKFIELLRKSKRDLYGESDKNDSQPFVKNANQIYDQYTFLPSNMTTRVKDLVKDITDLYEADIDKVRAIETYLSNNHTYTLEPDLPNDDQDNLVDYFLFESKEGFCIHYASAMVVMVRILGLPARYVTGYKLPYTIPMDDLRQYQYMHYEQAMEKVPSSDFGVQTYYVRDTDAHAWVEVYFEGYGWLTFEPTKVYYDEFHQYADAYKSYTPDLSNNSNLDVSRYVVNKYIKWIILYGSITILLIIISIPIIKRMKLRKMLRQSNSKEKIFIFYQLNMVLIGLLYQPREPSCSIRQYIYDAADFLQERSIELIKGATIIEKSMYGTDEIQSSDVIFLQNLYTQLKEAGKKRMKKISYIWYKYKNKIL